MELCLNLTARWSHSGAHVLAKALCKLYPNISLLIGPAIEEGFYYDFNLNDPTITITLKDLAKIEKK